MSEDRRFLILQCFEVLGEEIDKVVGNVGRIDFCSSVVSTYLELDFDCLDHNPGKVLFVFNILSVPLKKILS